MLRPSSPLSPRCPVLPGVKASYERSLGGGRRFAYGGAGPEYFWTNDDLHDGSGFGVLGEAGVGYIVSRHLRVRAGLDVRGMYTDAGRQSPADDGNARWPFVVAPVVGEGSTPRRGKETSKIVGSEASRRGLSPAACERGRVLREATTPDAVGVVDGC